MINHTCRFWYLTHMSRRELSTKLLRRSLVCLYVLLLSEKKKENVSVRCCLRLICFVFFLSIFLFCVFFLSLSLSWNNHRLVCSLVQNKNKTKPLSIFVWFLVLLDTVLLPLCNPCAAHSAVVTSIAGPSPDSLNRTDSKKKKTLRNYSTNFEIYRLCITTTTTTTCTAYPQN